MRLTHCLYAQHIGRQIKRHWYGRNKQKLIDLNSDKYLIQKGIEIVDAKNFAGPFTFRRYDMNSFKREIPSLPEGKMCYTYGDKYVLVQGCSQAEIITKTITIENKLPDRIEALTENSECSEQAENIIKRSIQTCTTFDAHQEKLPRRKHLTKLMWVYPRDYGILPLRQITNLGHKFLHLCDHLSGPEIVNNRGMVFNGHLCYPFEKDSDSFHFKVIINLMVTSNSPLKQFCDKNMYSDKQIADLDPIHYTSSLQETTCYDFNHLYPIDANYRKYHAHTIFAHYDPLLVQNFTELPVKEDQFLSHSLMKSFITAASYARQRFSLSVEDLPEPISIQCISSDGQNFHFSVFQLNTLNLNGTEGIKNYWWSMPKIKLYETAGYNNGKPVLDGYNPEVFKRILAFYKNT